MTSLSCQLLAWPAISIHITKVPSGEMGLVFKAISAGEECTKAIETEHLRATIDASFLLIRYVSVQCHLLPLSVLPPQNQGPIQTISWYRSVNESGWLARLL